MQGPTWTMSPSSSRRSSLPRAFSSPTLPDLVSVDVKQSSPPKDDSLIRSASFSSLTSIDTEYKNGMERLTFADVSPESAGDMNGRDSKPGNRLTKEERPKIERIGRRKSLVARPKSWIQRVKGSPERQSSAALGNTTPSEIPPVPAISKVTRDNKTKSVSESFATFAKKSWISSSRSPSPNRIPPKGTDSERQAGGSKMTGSPITSSSRSANASPTKLEASSNTSSENPAKSSLLQSKSTTALQKLKGRPSSVLMSFTSFQSTNSSQSSLHRSSLDNRSTPRTSTDKIPPVSGIAALEKLQNATKDKPQRRDELWSAFRSLENDFTKFQAKSWSLKTNVVRASLLPFLKTHMNHPSNKNLRPEDLDRRVTILNKWWTGILEVLDGRQNQTVSGVDRPVLLEACYSIMTRPEWRLSPSHFSALGERSPNRTPSRSPHRHSLLKRNSSSSVKSSATQFMTESVYHNTRVLFVQNLLTQLSFVVDKMSLRHAPASLVTFCGKAVAYAFFFVPGIADILVRIWKLQSETLRRVSDELGMPRRPNKLDTDEVVAAFPAHVQNLGWTSVNSMSTNLRKPPVLPILAAKIPWYGPWTSRWCGRDSDLFFVFAKHYHILVEEFLPSELRLLEKARAPGFILVQAQILSALDGTIHRQPSAEPPPITFDDVLAGADASAAALPLPSNNSARLMAENRLIMLLRDFLSEQPSEYEVARSTFAESFGKMMQAAARKTSIFDHNACFVLCDFMEEALTIFVRFHHALQHSSDFIDWTFWLDVCKKMLESQNSMSEIRLFAFLYTTWNVVTNDERRKAVVCLEWLLAEETFHKFFNHWCPMVRAYYMRLLCWRICREDGDASDLDTKIFKAALTRIKSSWSHYLFLKRSAENAKTLPPSTAPCHPAPGRRLLIIRNDNQSPSANLFLGFDGIMTPATPQVTGSNQATAYKRHSSLGNISKSDIPDGGNPKLTTDRDGAVPAAKKKRWTFGGMIPSTFASSLTEVVTPPTTRGPSPTKTLEDARKETSALRARPTLPTKTSSSESETPTSTMTHRVFSFKFSLEWGQHFDTPKSVTVSGKNNSNSSPPKAAKNNGSVNGNPRGGVGFNIGPERRLSSPRLPAAAQTHLTALVPGVTLETQASDPKNSGPEAVMRAKYAGRALAEWLLIVTECNNFVERRRSEGVPGLKWVEVPTLGVEGFRKF